MCQTSGLRIPPDGSSARHGAGRRSGSGRVKADSCPLVRRCCNPPAATPSAYRDGRTVDVDAEAMWPTPTYVEFMVTVAVVGIPRHVVTRRVMLAELASVEREDGAVWRL